MNRKSAHSADIKANKLPVEWPAIVYNDDVQSLVSRWAWALINGNGGGAIIAR